MKKIISFAFVLALVLALTGCGKETTPEYETVPLAKGDFAFSLPVGYSVANERDTKCDIVDANNQTVGGIDVTQLTETAVSDSSDPSFMHYLDFVGGKEVNSEYVTMSSSNEHICQLVNNKITNPETSEATEYTRFFIAKNGVVYDMWLNNGLVTSEVIDMFKSTI